MDRYQSFIEHCRKKKYHPEEYLEKHHITPRHEGGDDSKENLVKLSLKDHITAHQVRYEVYGNKYDLAALNYMRGQSKEAKKIICSANGSKSKGRKLSQEHRRKLSRPGELNSFYGKSHTDVTKNIIREKAIGRKWTKETKDKLSKTLKSRPDITCPRRCNIYGKEYSSASEASKILNISKSLLRYRCNSANWNQYIWLDPPANNKRPLSSRRVLIDNKEYESLTQAASVLNLHPRTVSKRCKSGSFTNYSFL